MPLYDREFLLTNKKSNNTKLIILDKQKIPKTLPTEGRLSNVSLPD
jgi:hypothetical protein